MSSEPLRGVAFDFYFKLSAIADPSKFLTDPTLASGDFQVSTDDSIFANLANLPFVVEAGKGLIKATLSTSEMTGSVANVSAIDVSGNEWSELAFSIPIPAGNSDTILDIIDGDHIETSTSLRINKKGTTTAVLEKDISGSLLQPDVTVRTTEKP